MRPRSRILAMVLGSAIYWIAALFLVALAASILPGDCWTERTGSGFDQCAGQVRAVAVAGLGIAALIYGAVIRRLRRRT
jgi:hypothetical protein